jgi:3-oxoacyl-[acyl-carrier protein] reductase
LHHSAEDHLLSSKEFAKVNPITNLEVIMQYSLQGSIAIVTGASRKIGIGAAIARALAEIGADLFITYYRPYDATMPWGSAAQEAEALLDDLRAMGIRAAGMELDLAQPAAASQLFDSVEKLLGPADILINNATNSAHSNIIPRTLTA